MSTKTDLSRRRFLSRSAAVAAPLVLPGGAGLVRGAPANGKLSIGVIGAGGKGAVDTDGCASESIAALCDVDSRTLANRLKKYPGAKGYKDYRVMLEEMGGRLDAVVVSTPDHHHFPAAMLAMKQGLHVYVQKPLAHSVWEAREMLKTAREHGCVTQMGNQGHSFNSTRRLVECVRAGAIGEVEEVHVWTDRPIWPQGMGRPDGSKPVPSTLDWDLWLGPAPERPFHDGYHPFKWRAFWDFGTGALGDMGCHNIDAAFWALELGAPSSITAESSGINPETAPKWSVVCYEFPARGTKPAVTLTWYDGGKRPDPGLIGARELPKNGSLIIGSKATIAFQDWNPNGFRVVKDGKDVEIEEPEASLPRANDNPYREWLTACRGGPPCLSNFEYSVPLTEMVLLGNVALRTGERIEWDAPNLQVPGSRRAASYLRREPRKGWEV